MASMEPRSFKRGNDAISLARRRAMKASMEPRSFKRGNTAERLRPQHTEYVLQWSHVHSNVETGEELARAHHEKDASMEPHSFKRGNSFHASGLCSLTHTLQWSHVHSNVETSRSSTENKPTRKGFNGATFIQTWKQVKIKGFREIKPVASMEPRSFKRGNMYRQIESNSLISRFNGATFIQTWKQ